MGVLEFRVVDAETKKPLETVRATITTWAGQEKSKETKKSGRVTFFTLAPSGFITLEKSGYKEYSDLWWTTGLARLSSSATIRLERA